MYNKVLAAACVIMFLAVVLGLAIPTLISRYQKLKHGYDCFYFGKQGDVDHRFCVSKDGRWISFEGTVQEFSVVTEIFMGQIRKQTERSDESDGKRS